MNMRYQNPHQPYMMPQQQYYQPNQQHPQQQQSNLQEFIQSTIANTLAQILPNMVAQLTQGQARQTQGHYEPQMTHGLNRYQQQEVGNRFNRSRPNENIQTPIQSFQNPVQQNQGGPSVATNVEMNKAEKKQKLHNLSLVVEPKIITYTNNNEVKVATVTNAPNPHTIHVLEKNIQSDCLDEVIEATIENSHTEELDKYTIINHYGIVQKTFYQCRSAENFKELAENAPDKFYKDFVRLYQTRKSEDDLLILDYISQHLTSHINRYLKVNSAATLSIDFFETDYNDLLMLINRENQYNITYDDLISYTTTLIDDLNIVFDADESGKPIGKDIEVAIRVPMVYVKITEAALGLTDVSDQMTTIEPVPHNVFLNGLVESTHRKLEVTDFVLITKDRKKFRMACDKNGMKAIIQRI